MDSEQVLVLVLEMESPLQVASELALGVGLSGLSLGLLSLEELEHLFEHL